MTFHENATPFPKVDTNAIVFLSRNLNLVGKSYGSGAIKVESRNLDKVPIPEHIVDKYNLKRQKYKTKTQQLELF
ncbi:hypothetical protein [Dolichospermum sp. FACHB-1091]|uniref:hypothetical protein n=1 Tax=Dolichospermum sp. FACHB-1091 TaxID=2692798 RepID=UPI0018F02E5D|nr:hypothetical protein [Dolichospermum sp. FACHB-1091]